MLENTINTLDTNYMHDVVTFHLIINEVIDYPIASIHKKRPL